MTITPSTSFLTLEAAAWAIGAAGLAGVDSPVTLADEAAGFVVRGPADAIAAIEAVPAFESDEAVAIRAVAEQYRRREGINAERDRRIVAGSVINGIAVPGDQATQVNLLALKDTARDLKAADVTAPALPFRDAANVEHALTPDQMISLVDAGKLYVQQVYSASWALKAMEPIPADFANDSYWP